MRAAVLHDVRDIRVTEIPTPTPAADEVIVRVKAVGVCGSDLHSYLEGGTTGPTRINPFVLGHEFSGTLTSESAKRAGLPADALFAIDPSISCGRCEWCHRGHTNLCPNVRFLGYAPNNGAMAEFICVPTSALHIVPDSIGPAGAAILETLGVAIHAIDLARPRLMETVAVVGCGPVGLLLIQLARFAGVSKIIAVDPVKARADLACDLGADVGCGSPEEAVSFTNGRGADLVIEATDSSHGFEHAARSARIGGRLVIVGIPENNQYVLSGAESRRKGLSIKFSRRMPEVYPRAIALAESGHVKLAPLATHRFSLDQTPAAFEQQVARRDGIIKAIIYP
ncbi:zinc-binding dehydrogenase [Bradyrhizobium sp.]|uniref:zinc-dependent alcohol dehydrogenase n=1 Tax=unclassified Bradyrhizobium TaxID=2631580 RepID=UPI0007C92E08|nr:alcohol dehydrogenase catalytic domain-containing protein [Bradyrhizobium sp.]